MDNTDRSHIRRLVEQPHLLQLLAEIEQAEEKAAAQAEKAANYEAIERKYLETKAKLDTAVKGDAHTATEKYKQELERARCEMAHEQLRCGWEIPENINNAICIERKAQCMAWQGRSVRVQEERYWKLLALAAECIADGQGCASEHMLTAAGRLWDRWFEVAWRE